MRRADRGVQEEGLFQGSSVLLLSTRFSLSAVALPPFLLSPPCISWTEHGGQSAGRAQKWLRGEGTGREALPSYIPPFL